MQLSWGTLRSRRWAYTAHTGLQRGNRHSPEKKHLSLLLLSSVIHLVSTHPHLTFSSSFLSSTSWPSHKRTRKREGKIGNSDTRQDSLYIYRLLCDEGGMGGGRHIHRSHGENRGRLKTFLLLLLPISFLPSHSHMLRCVKENQRRWSEPSRFLAKATAESKVASTVGSCITTKGMPWFLCPWVMTVGLFLY